MIPDARLKYYYPLVPTSYLVSEEPPNWHRNGIVVSRIGTLYQPVNSGSQCIVGTESRSDCHRVPPREIIIGQIVTR